MDHVFLRGKNVLITGSAKRVGAALVRAFAAAGANVMIHCCNSRQDGETLWQSIGGSAQGHSLLCFDFAVPEDIAGFWNTLPVQPDILINNASVFKRLTLRDESLLSAKEQFNVNFWAPVEMMRQMA